STPPSTFTLFDEKFWVKSPRVPEVTFSADRRKTPRWPPTGKPPPPVSLPPWMSQKPSNERVGGPGACAPKAVTVPKRSGLLAAPETSVPLMFTVPVTRNDFGPALWKAPCWLTITSMVIWPCEKSETLPPEVYVAASRMLRKSPVLALYV